MIYTEHFEHDGLNLVRYYSDKFLIHCEDDNEDIVYGEVIEMATSSRVYVETDIPLEKEEPADEAPEGNDELAGEAPADIL